MGYETDVAFHNMQKLINKMITEDDVCNCFNTGDVTFNEIMAIGNDVKIYEVYDNTEYEEEGAKIEIVVKQGRLIQSILKG